MNSQSKKIVSAAAVTATLLGALTYAVYRSRTFATSSAKNDGCASAAKGERAELCPPQQKRPQPTAKPTMPLPSESAIPPEERAKAFELLDALKQQANIAFQESRYEDAIKRYQDCLEVTAALGAHDAEAVKVDQVVRANVIMAFIRMHDYDAARFVATMLLQDAAVALPEDLQVKVLYRRGLASKFLGDKEAALADFEAALHFSKDGSNAPASREIELLKRGR
jgi:tetratricopeptide (TPR) repeat protein